MSGEGGGALIGGLFILGMAPMILGAAAAAGVAYGTFKVAQVAVGSAQRHYRANQAKKQLEVDNCSKELSDFYRKMQEAVTSQQELSDQYCRQVAQEMEAASENLKAMSRRKPDVAAWERSVSQVRAMASDRMGAGYRQELEQIRARTEKEAAAQIRQMERMKAEKERLVDWKSKKAQDRALQKAVALEMVRDASASVKLMGALGASSRDAAFQAQARVMEKQLEKVQHAFDAEIYDMAAADAQKIISTCASLALEHTQSELMADELATRLEARISGLLGEIEKRRNLHFKSASHGAEGEEVQEDLADFSQGRLQECVESLQEMQKKVNARGTEALDGTQLLLLEQEFDEILEPNARLILRTAEEALALYYEKLYALEVMADFLYEQNYQLEWAQPVAGDPSQKLVVHFTNQFSRNSISITLDADTTAQEAAQMAMEILFFYDKGREVSETEKQTLRNHLTDALHEAGIRGSLSCKGAVGQASGRTELNDQQQVLNMAAVPLLAQAGEEPV